ncbi:MAG: carboxypeptidase-like regulatory domain-containing protein [Myxococcota bacterium]
MRHAACGGGSRVTGRGWIVAALVLGVATPAFAQEPRPRGPADVIERAREEATREGMRDAAEAADDPRGSEDDEEAMRRAHGGVDQATLRRVMGEGPPITTAEASDEVPAGAVRVTVVDQADEPVADAPVRLGILESGGNRRSQAKPTDEAGLALFEDLPTGNGQAYRVSVTHEGATYGADPFQLPADQGYQVRIVRLPVTHDTNVLLQAMGQTILELRNDRLGVMQQSQLMNMSDRTLVLPDAGVKVRLPEDFTGFQAQEVMTDQRLESTDDGFRLKGSIPPGKVDLMWKYDLPVGGTAMDFGFPMPFRTFRYRVVAEAIPGLEMSVSELGAVMRHEGRSGELLIAQGERGPEDPPLESLSIHLENIPGPGPWRWIAVAGALLLALAAVFLGAGGDRRAESQARAREEHKQRLLAEAVELERLRSEQEIGPEYHERRMNEVLIQLAALLKQDDRARGTQPDAAVADKPADT